MAIGNFRRRHRNKKEKRRRPRQWRPRQLQSQDGVEWVVSKAAASRYGDTIEAAIMSGLYYDDYVQTRRSYNMGYRLIRLFVESSGLDKVINFSDQQASDHGWDAAGFIRGLNHATLFDLVLVLAAEKLQNRGLLDLTCRTINDMIHGKSPTQIHAMFGIRPPQPSGRHGKTAPKKVMTPDQKKQVEILKKKKKKQVESEERALRALHAVRSHEFTVYDSKHNYFLQTRLFYLYNYAFFDLDKESEFIRGPPLHEVPPPLRESLVYSAVNFISLKVRESGVGFPINVFGTVIARDDIDYRCVYLLREEDDAQIITSSDETLTLMDPRRGLVPEDYVYFEFNLKIKCDGGAVKDFSRGLTVFNSCRLPDVGKQSMTVPLTTCLSTVELLCADVWRPLEASISMNILKGSCDLTTVAAWNTDNTEDRIILYDSRAAASKQIRTKGNSIGLARRVVAVPLDGKLVIHLVVVNDDDDETEELFLILGHSNNEHKHVCKIGRGEVEVKVAWTAVPEKWKRCKKFEHIGDHCLLL